LELMKTHVSWREPNERLERTINSPESLTARLQDSKERPERYIGR
jgi:hypothetical protein